MNIIRHQSVLSCLEKRALKYRKDCPTLKQMDEVLYQESLDETGTVPLNSLTEFDKDYITSKEKTVEWKEEKNSGHSRGITKGTWNSSRKETRMSYKNII